jgi:hypothetical protein
MSRILAARWTTGLLLLPIACLYTGCAIGPKSIECDQLKYNDAVQVTANEEMLLNLVRVTYHEPLEFFAVGGITDQHELNQSLGLVPSFTSAGPGLAPHADFRWILLPQAGASAATRPTISYTPLVSEEFAKRLHAPVGVETIYLFTKNGRKLERVLRLVAQNINGVKNDPDFPSDFESFL